MIIKRKVVVIAVVVLGAIAVAAGIWIYNKPHRAVATETAAFTLSAAELANAFSEDETAANRIYAGKVIQVRGEVAEIASDGSMVVLGGPEQMTRVSCYLQGHSKPKATALEKGGLINVKGVCNGLLMDVVLDKCILLED